MESFFLTKNVKLSSLNNESVVLTITNLLKPLGDIQQELNKYNVEAVIFKGSFNDQILNELPFQKIQRISFYDNKSFDINLLLKYKRINYLVISQIHDMEIDFSNFPVLKEIIQIEWSPKLIFNTCDSLNNLYVSYFNKSNVLDQFPQKLEYLELIKGEVLSLKGIERNLNLKGITLVSLPKLEDFESISNLSTLEFIRFSGCPKLNELDFLKKCRNLKWITIENCKEIKSLKPLNHLENLKGVKVMGNTKILDNDKSLIKTKRPGLYYFELMEMFESHLSKKK